MELPDSNFIIDFTKINWVDYRPDGINQLEVASAYSDDEKEWYPILDTKTGERYFYTIGFSSRARFLFILLKEHPTDINRLFVEKLIVAQHEPQIRKYYYETKFQGR